MFENSRFDSELELYESADSRIDFEGKPEDNPKNPITKTGQELEPGDIILSTTVKDPISDSIRAVEKWKTGGDPLSSHSAIYIGNFLVAEAIHEFSTLKDLLNRLISGVAINPKQGVIIRSIDEKLKGDSYAFVLRYKGPWRDKPTQQKIIIKNLREASQFGKKKKYDFTGVFKQAFFNNYKGDGNKFYCSELLLNAYEKAGITLLSRPMELGTPQGYPSDLERSPDLLHIGFLKTSENKEFYDEFEIVTNLEYRDDKDRFLGEKIDKDVKEKYDIFLDKLQNYYYEKKIEYTIGQISYFRNDPLRQKKLFYILNWLGLSKDVVRYSIGSSRPLWYRVLNKFIVFPASVVAVADLLFFVGMMMTIREVIEKFFIELKSALMFGGQLAFLHGLSRTLVCKIQHRKPPALDLRVKKENKHLAEAYEEGVEAAGKLMELTKYVNQLDKVDEMNYEDAVKTVFLYLGLLAFKTINSPKKIEWIIKIHESLVREADSKIYFGNTWSELWHLFRDRINESNDYEFEIVEFNNQNSNIMENNYYLESDEEYNDEYEDYEDDQYEGYEDNEGDEEYDDEYEDNETTDRYAERLEELAQESFEDSYELNAELDNELEEMENQYFVKRLDKRRRRKGGRRHGKGKGVFGKILKAGANIVGKVAGSTPIGKLIKTGAAIATGHFKDAAKNLAQAAIGTALPGIGTVASAALDAVSSGEEGGGESEVKRRRRRACNKVAQITRDGFKELADNFPIEFEDPEVARTAARDAMKKSMAKHGVRPQRPASGKDSPDKKGSRRIIKLKPGEQVIIIRPMGGQ